VRALYVTAYPTALSESYIRTEIEWMQRQGVEVTMLAREDHPSPYASTVPAANIMKGENVGRAIERFKPDIAHGHWAVSLDDRGLQALARHGVPTTVRGHAFEVAPGTMRPLLAAEAVKRIWVFPHFVADYPSPKVAPLTCCYDNTIYTPGSPARRRRVLRVMAGLASKRVEAFADIARLCPGIDFTLVMTRAHDPGYPEKIQRTAPPNLDVRVNLAREAVRDLMLDSSIYLVTEPSHRFGMPVSIAEAMGSGMWPLLPNVPSAADYIGDAGRCFSTVEEAAALVREAVTWPIERWADVHAAAVAQAQRFRADAVLPPVLEEWRQLAGVAT
jgi:glycosyltransferase involved in cell wall biosynthesis